MADVGATWASIPDDGGALATAYRVAAPPQTYFIDTNGILKAIQIGQVLESDFTTQYAKIKP